MRKLVILFVAFSLQSISAQDYEIINHSVQMGETVRMISRKYKVEPAEIYRLNKFAIDGIRQGMVLQIPVIRKERAESESSSGPSAPSEGQPPSTNEITHTVVAKETLFSIAKQYNVTVEDIKRQNPKVKSKGLQAGQILTITISN